MTGLWILWLAVTVPAQINETRPLFCDPVFAELFTPQRAQLGRYEACADPRPLDDVAAAGSIVESMGALDAFGAAGRYDRVVLARLYGGVKPRVAHGWTETAGRFEATTLISPHPNASLTRLEPGTLIIRWICERDQAECKMLNAGR